MIEPLPVSRNCGHCKWRSERLSGEHCKPCVQVEIPYRNDTKFAGFEPLEEPFEPIEESPLEPLL